MIRSWMGKAAVAALVALAPVATASAQANYVSLNGTVNLGDNPANTANLLVNFLGASDPRGTMTVAASGGLLSGIGLGTTASVSDLEITPTGGNVLSAPFLQVGGYTFSNPTFIVTNTGTFSFGPVNLTQEAGNVNATLNLSGMLMGPGLAAGQTFNGSFTTQFAGYTIASLIAAIESPGGLQNQAVSASFSFNVVPEPSTYALMGLGLAGMAFFARRRRLV